MTPTTATVATEKVLLTPEETARALGIGRSKVYELILSHTLESVKIGTCRRVPTDALTTYVASLRAGRS